MGHRTLVAYDRTGYDLHYAHWGVDPDHVTPETPFGRSPETPFDGAMETPPGGTPNADRAGRRVPAGLDADGGRPTGDRRTAVDPDPVATDLTFSDVCSSVDPIEHEALFVVDADFAVRTYLVVALRRGEDTDPDADAGGSSRARGALVGYDDPADAAYVRGWLAGARAVRDTGSDDVIRALRWLDPARGTLLWLADGEHCGAVRSGRSKLPH